jgi:hypothetical protein
LIVCGLILVASGARAADDARDLGAVNRNYEDVAAHLDTGGDLYVIVNVEGAIESAIDGITNLVAMLPPDPGTAALRAALPRLKGFLGRQGFHALNGVGASVVPRADGLNNVKVYVARDAEAATRPLWRGLVGGAPRKLASAAGPQPVMMGQAMQRLMGAQGPQSCAMVFVNLRPGVLVSGISASGGREVAASLSVAPIGLMAAIAIPSFVKARNESQNHACINNLRILDAAKEHWAMEMRAETGAVADPEGVLDYVKGQRMPVCPAGGHYELGPIGTDPTCSVPGHRLP